MNELAGRIRDIHQPAPDFWWPPAPGWWLLGGLLLAVAGGAFFRWRRRRALRRAALAELRSIAACEDPRRQAAALNRLLRRVALARRPRRQVASLRGEAWLEFLDRLGGSREFSRGAGRALLQAPYDPRADYPSGPLLELVQRWLERVT